MAACDWPIDTTCCPDWDSYSPEVQAMATTMATEILDALTGRRFAQCEMNYRPCGPKCQTSFGYMTWPVNAPAVGAGIPWMIPYVDSGVWRNCVCSGGCTCRAAHEVPFPGPVVEVTTVTLDGVVLDPSAYRLDYFRGVPVLVRTDGDPWPDCQDMSLGIGEIGSFNIVYQPGELLPQGGQYAAGLLACDYAKGCTGGDCVLPQQLVSLSRNGVEVQVADPTTLLENGLTGIAQVDQWIRAVNPRAKAQRSRVYSLDLPGRRFTV